MPTVNFVNNKPKIALHKADINLLLKAAGVMELLARNERDGEASQEFQAACNTLRAAIIFCQNLGNENIHDKEEVNEPAPETVA